MCWTSSHTWSFFTCRSKKKINFNVTSIFLSIGFRCWSNRMSNISFRTNEISRRMTINELWCDSIFQRLTTLFHEQNQSTFRHRRSTLNSVLVHIDWRVWTWFILNFPFVLIDTWTVWLTESWTELIIFITVESLRRLTNVHWQRMILSWQEPIKLLSTIDFRRKFLSVESNHRLFIRQQVFKIL